MVRDGQLRLLGESSVGARTEPVGDLARWHRISKKDDLPAPLGPITMSGCERQLRLPSRRGRTQGLLHSPARSCPEET